MPIKETTSGERDAQTYAVIGAAIEVHRVLGPGFLEPVYREAFGMELAARHVPFDAEPLVGVRYKDRQMATIYRPDFICFDQVLVEVKALAALGPGNIAQVINYLKATGLTRALLLNFGSRRLEHKRVIRSSVPVDEGDMT